MDVQYVGRPLIFFSAPLSLQPAHLRICRQALPIIATLPSSETDGGKFCIDIHTEEEGVGAGCEDMTTPQIKQQPYKILGSQEKKGALEKIELPFTDVNAVWSLVCTRHVSMKVNSWSLD